jgi:hypothetical protein
LPKSVRLSDLQPPPITKLKSAPATFEPQKLITTLHPQQQQQQQMRMSLPTQQQMRMSYTPTPQHEIASEGIPQRRWAQSAVPSYAVYADRET